MATPKKPTQTKPKVEPKIKIRSNQTQKKPKGKAVKRPNKHSKK